MLIAILVVLVVIAYLLGSVLSCARALNQQAVHLTWTVSHIADHVLNKDPLEQTNAILRAMNESQATVVEFLGVMVKFEDVKATARARVANIINKGQGAELLRERIADRAGK